MKINLLPSIAVVGSLLFSTQTAAQDQAVRCDTMFLRDSSVRLVQQISLVNSTVKFQNCPPDNQLYKIQKSDILKIRMSNGGQLDFEEKTGPKHQKPGDKTESAAAKSASKQPVIPPGKVFIYGSVGGGVPSGGHGSLDFLFGKKYSISIFHTSNQRNSPKTPPNYDGGLCFFGDCSKVFQTLNSTGLAFGKVFAGNSPRVRYHLKAGIGAGTFEHPENFRPRHSNGWLDFGSNYEYDRITDHSTSLVLQATVECPFSRFLGIGTGLFANINRHWPIIGLSVSNQIGYLRKRIKKQ